MDEIARWNRSSWRIPTPREAGEEPRGPPVEEWRRARRGGGYGRGAARLAVEGGRGGVLRGSPAEGEMEPRHGGPPCRARASCPGAPPCRALAPRSPSRRWRKVGRGSTACRRREIGEDGQPPGRVPPPVKGGRRGAARRRRKAGAQGWLAAGRRRGCRWLSEGERGWPIPPNTEGEGSVLRKGYFSCGLIPWY